MPWSSQNGDGWKGGGGPWGQGPQGQPPSHDIEDFLKKGQDRLKQALPGGGMSGSFLFLLFLAALAAIVYIGFTVRVQPNEVGVVMQLGKFDRELPPGLNFRLPFPLEEVEIVNVTTVRRSAIGAQNVFRSSSSRDEESLMLTGDENIVFIDFVVLWQIKEARDYVFNIKNKPETVKFVAESAMREVAGKSEIQRMLTEDRAQTEIEVKDLIQSTLDHYKAGIVINQVQMQKVDPPAQVIDAFRDVQAAKADEQRLQNQAESYANRVIPEARGEAARIRQAAEGYKDQTIAEATGQADRFLKVYKEYEKAPNVTRQRIFLETMEKVLGGTDKVIIDSKGSGQGVVPYLPLDRLQNRRPQSRRVNEGAPQ